jgi:hypothetical protein
MTERIVKKIPSLFVFGGFLLTAVASFIGWLQVVGHGYIPRRFSANSFALVVGLALVGLAWWLCMPVLQSMTAGRLGIRLALRVFAIASAILGIARVVAYPDVYGSAERTSLLVYAIGMFLAAIGFWMASMRISMITEPERAESLVS